MYQKIERTMKKMFVGSLLILLTTGSCYAGNDRSIEVALLPEKIKGFIATHFDNKNIAFAKEETEWFEKSYKVIFTDGSSAEFDRKGNWIEVKNKQASLSAELLPEKIREKVIADYDTLSIREVERKSGAVEIKFTSGMEVTFDKDGKITDIDY